MKSTGIVRKIDSLGRILVPKEVRKTMGLNEGTPMDIFVDGRKLILRDMNQDVFFVLRLSVLFY